MATNDSVPSFGNADTYTATASTAVKPGDCLATASDGRVTLSGVADGAFAGVAAFAAPAGELVTVRTTGVHQLRCSGAIAGGVRVTTAAGGTVVAGEPAIGVTRGASVNGAVRVKLIAAGGSGGGGGGGGASWADVHAAAEKPIPADVDDLPLMDSVSGWQLKRITFAALKARMVEHFATATAILTNKTLTSPTVTGGTFSSPTVTGVLPWSQQSGTTSEAIGTPGRVGIITTGLNSPAVVLPTLQNGLAYHILRGGLYTATVNGVDATYLRPENGPSSQFAPNRLSTVINIKATTDVVVIEIDPTTYRTKVGQLLIGYESRHNAYARDVTIEAWDGSIWRTVGSVKGTTSHIFAARAMDFYGSVTPRKIRWTFTNFYSTPSMTMFAIVSLFAIQDYEDSAEGYGGYLTRTGGELYGTTAEPPGFTPPTGVPLRLGVSNADVEVLPGVPLTSLVAPPASATAAGRRGQFAIAADGSSLMLCVTTGAAGAASWKRVALTTF